MKKIIALCSVLVILAIVVTMFTSCADKTEDVTTTESTAIVENNQVIPEQSGFTVEISDTQAIVKKDGQEFQILNFPNNPNVVFDKAYADEHCEFLDMNFDGQPDFYIAVSSVNGVVSYYCWLYNATTNQFDYSIILSAIKNISVDAQNHRILSTVKNGDSTVVVSYHWVDGDLVLEKRYDDPSLQEEITKVVEDNAIGVDKPSTTPADSDTNKTTNKVNKPNKPANDKTTNADKPVSTTKETKPVNTTTTEPYTGGVQLGTGDMDEGWY